MKNSDIRNLRLSRRRPAAAAWEIAAFVCCWCLIAAAAYIISSCSQDVDTARNHAVGPNPGLVVEAHNSEASVLVTTERGSADRFVVRLADAPRDEVTLSITGLDPSEARVEPLFLTFDQESWHRGQTVTVTGVDDEDLDGSQNSGVILDTSQSTDEAYASLGAASLTVVNVDNDGPGATLIDGRMEFWEHGGEGNFWLVLNTPPDDRVVLHVGCTDASEALLSTGSSPAGEQAVLQFTPSNWSIPQQVYLAGQDDDQMDGNQIFDLTVSVDVDATGDSTGYLAVSPLAVTVKVKDGETTGVDVYLARNCGQ